jgi:hypothetical protein
MKTKISFAIMVLLGTLLSCNKDYPVEKDNNLQTQMSPGTSTLNQFNKSGQIKIAVVSDIHYMDPSGLKEGAQTGAAFQFDRSFNHYSLVEFSAPIFSKIISELLLEKPDVVLFTGDLAKEGEEYNHLRVNEKLQQLVDAGIKVYIVPGHSDINNPNSKEYIGNTSSPVPTITREQYVDMYANFGFKDAISKDVQESTGILNSLSYVAEPTPGLRILCIDGVNYPPYYTPNYRKGRIRQETMKWIKIQMEEAKKNNITVLGLMHHNLLEHFERQMETTPTALVDDWRARADSLASWGLEIMFTGHNHANDITVRDTLGRLIYDIQTGTIVSSTSPYRMCILKNKQLSISTSFITSIPVAIPGNLSFTEYAQVDVFNALERLFANVILASPVYNIPPEFRPIAAPIVTRAFIAYLDGDEKLSPQEQEEIYSLQKILPNPEYTVKAITSFWTDHEPKDLKCDIKQSAK